MNKTPSTIEPLFACPQCGQENFTAKGLQAHQGKKACIKRQEENAVAITKAHPELGACVARFQTWQGFAKQSTAALKLCKYFAGLEVHALYDLHRTIYGETRGGDHGVSKTEPPSVLPLETFLEQHLGITARTARKYRDWFLSISSPEENAKLTERLNGWYIQRMPKALTAGTQAAALSMSDIGTLIAADMQEILSQPDEWGLHELFEVPIQDVTPDETVEDEPEPPPSDKDRLIKFWHVDLTKKIATNEFLRLPKTQREAVMVAMEEAVNKIKPTLKKKGAPVNA